MITDWVRALTEPRVLGGLVAGLVCLVAYWVTGWDERRLRRRGR